MMKQMMRYSIRYATYVAAALVTLTGVGMAQGAAQSAAQSVDGGFRVGDRIALTIEGPVVMSDTLTVREGLLIQIPNIGDISLQGVRRANAQTYLTDEVHKYIKTATVRAVPLVRIAVVGEVARPGYYSVPADLLLSDVVMRAGGPTPNGDLNRSVVRRGADEVMKSGQLTNALSSGQTIEGLQLASGDQIVVGAKKQSNLDTVLKVTGAVAALAAVGLTLALRN